jgi:hypothetical protein
VDAAARHDRRADPAVAEVHGPQLTEVGHRVDGDDLLERVV